MLETEFKIVGEKLPLYLPPDISGLGAIKGEVKRDVHWKISSLDSVLESDVWAHGHAFCARTWKYS